MTQSPFYEPPNDYGTTSSRDTNKTLMIVVIVLVTLVLCCCCITLVVLWFTGDSILEFFDSLRIFLSATSIVFRCNTAQLIAF